MLQQEGGATWAAKSSAGDRRINVYPDEAGFIFSLSNTLLHFAQYCLSKMTFYHKFYPYDLLFATSLVFNYIKIALLKRVSYISVHL